MALSPPFEGKLFEKGAKAVGGLAAIAGGISGIASGLAGGGLFDGGIGFNGRQPPTANGLATRQAQVPTQRDGISVRQAMRFMIPEQPIVEMYINPRQVKYNYKKLIQSTRVKGGYNLQYWGEDLATLMVSGTTGTSGIEGINVLMDVYRNEQLMFDPYALFLQAERDKANKESFDNLLFGDGGPFGLGDVPILGDVIGAASDQISGAIGSNIVNSRNKPTLASLAFTVEIYWSGEVYRGFFENFNFDESSERIGLFDYDFTFKVTQKRGFRTNFFPWHKHPSHGQSNWDIGGPPLSYGKLVSESAPPGRNAFDQPNLFKAIADGGNALANNLRDIKAADIIDAFII